MDFWRTVAVLFRRFYITVPAFVLTLLVAASAYAATPVQYQSGAVIVLTTPLRGGTQSTNPESPTSLTNPLLSFDQSLALTASIVIQQLNSRETGLSLGVSPGGTTTYEVNNGSSNPELLQSGPLIFITTKAPTAEAAQALAEQLTGTAATALEQRQADLNAPRSTRIGTQVIVPPTAGQLLMDSPLRAAAAAGALACAAGLVAVYGFESLMTHWRRRRPRKPRGPVRDERPTLGAVEQPGRGVLTAVGGAVDPG